MSKAKQMGGKKRNAAGAPRSVADIEASIQEQALQLEALLTAGEKRIKSVSLGFSNRIFGKAQEAFETCESINQQAEDWRDELAAKHGASRAQLTTAREKTGRSVARAACAVEELQAVQAEAAELVAELRSKMIAVPSTSASKRRGQQQQQKRRKSVTFK